MLCKYSPFFRRVRPIRLAVPKCISFATPRCHQNRPKIISLQRSFCSTSATDDYKKKVKSGLVRQNSRQLKVAKVIDDVLVNLENCGYTNDKLDHKTLNNLKNAKIKGVYIHGGIGCGKTFMLNIFHQRCLDKNINCKRVHFHEFILDVHVQLHKLRKQHGSIPDLMEKVADFYFAESPVFAFDECHVLNVSDAMVMKGAMTALFNRGVVVVATSNLDPLSLYASGLNREVFYPFLQTLQENMIVWDMDSKVDFRQVDNENRRNVGFYIEPDKFDRLFRSQFPNAKMERFSFDLPFGRNLETEVAIFDGNDNQANKLIAIFEFSELCEKSLGAPEYTTISEEVDFVCVKNLPQFDPQNEDSCRRFVIFLDIMYDRNIQLIVTSDFSAHEVFKLLEEKYSSDLLAGSESMTRETDDRQQNFTGAISVSDDGGSSGKFATRYKIPGNIRYSDRGEYRPSNDENYLKEKQKEPDGWVEWSATGLKGASLYDLTGHLPEQQKDRLLPILRARSRLVELQKSKISQKTNVTFLSVDDPA